MPVLAGLRVEGSSIGGIATCIEVPEWRLAFDMGRASHSAVKRSTVLFTHTHVDHLGAVAAHAATRGLVGMPPPTYVVPRPRADAVRDLFEVWQRLDGGQLPHRLVPLSPGEEHALSEKLVARPFHSVHVVPTQGYAIWSRRRKLRPEYRGLSSEEIRDLRVGQGLEVTEELEVCELAFSGDTRIDLLEREPWLLQARRLILECTFVDERVSVEESRAKGHVHLEEIAERAAAFENEALLLTHFSSRYTIPEIRAALDQRLPAGLRERTAPLLEGHRTGTRQQAR